MLTADQSTLLTQLSGTWPTTLKLTLTAGQPAGVQSHPLGHELTALAEGRAASLPFFVGNKNEVAWFTLAPNDQEMRGAIEDLRAWILPSFGWEDPRGAMVIPGEATGALGQLILTMSPAGYFRWQMPKAQVERVIAKLKQMRALEQARPRHAVVRLSSLFELRQEFAVALTAGDRQAAESAVAAIDRRQLDSADNTLFMRIRLWGRFGDSNRIVNHPDLDRLISVRMPHRVRLSILEAFHAHFLASLEEERTSDKAFALYAAQIHDKLSGLIALASPADPVTARRLLGYRACVLRDAHQARELLSEPADPVLTNLLSALAKEGEQPAPTLEAQFLEARKRLDWKGVQDLGEALIGDHSEYLPILRRSLEFRPNQILWEALDALLPEAPARAGVAPVTPRTWTDWLALLLTGESAGLEAFLEDRQQGAAEGLGILEVQRLCDGLEELYTDPVVSQDARLRRALMSGLIELMDDFVQEPNFPRADLADVYVGLFRLWGSLKLGSVYPPDSQVLLELAEAALQFGRCNEAEVIALLRAWWEARPVKALLPFLLGTVEVLDRLGTEGQCENFWILAGDFVRSDPDVLSPGERLLWRQVGARIGYDAGTLDEYVPLPQEAAVDPISHAALKRVAIVSLRERQAQEAAALLRERSDAQTVVVSETHPGADTRSALAADVVLFVWSATTHAVFRAFDPLDRKRFAYVQGTGATSIVLALERWISKQVEDAGSA